LNCGTRPAVHLSKIEKQVCNTQIEPFFCSINCAAAYGIMNLLARGIRFCEKHGWYENDCVDCIDEFNQIVSEEES